MILTYPEETPAWCEKIRVADLFSGVGGAHVACQAAGLEVSIACDWDEGCAEFYKSKFPHVDFMQTSVANRSWWQRLQQHVSQFQLRLIVATPPCPDFSTLARRRGMTGSRGQLCSVTVLMAATTMVPAFIMEEVAGLLTSNRGEDL